MNAKNKIKIVAIVLLFFLLISIVTGKVLLEREKRVQLIAGNKELERSLSYEQFLDRDAKIEGTDNVEFSAFFLKDLNGDGYAEKVKGTCKELGGEDTLYFTINVLTEGYLKSGKIELEKDNFYFKTAIVADDIVKDNYVSDNTGTIEFNQIPVGTQKMVFGTVRSGVYSNYRHVEAIGKDTTKYSRINKVKFTGVYVNEEGTEISLEKIIEFPVDWYEEPKTEIPNQYADHIDNLNQNYNLDKMLKYDKGTVELEFSVAVQEIDNKQILEGLYVEGEIPELNGYQPLEVKVTGNGIIGTYDPETRKYTATRHARIDENGVLTEQVYDAQYKTQRYNILKFKVVYDIEAYTAPGRNVITLNVPIRATYYAYNNPNDEFDNPVASEVAEAVATNIYELGSGDIFGFDVKVGAFVASPYNAWVVSKAKVTNAYTTGIIEESTYPVYWYSERGNDATIEGLLFREPNDNHSDRFLTKDNTYISMEDYVSFKGIWFETPNSMFESDGFINVYNDDTDELIHSFTKEDWAKYSFENPYYYDSNVKHIRIETGTAKKNSNFNVGHIKELDVAKIVETIPFEQFKNIQNIYSYFEISAKRNQADEFFWVKTDIDRANYDDIVSMANITNINPSYFSTQETKENAIITITTQSASFNTIGWRDGEFIVKVPKEVYEMEINDITVSNPNVEIAGYSLEKREDDCYYISIYTENINKDEYDFYNILIDCNITPNPTVLSSNKPFLLYAINNVNTAYKSSKTDIYDVDNDGNVDEEVCYGSRNAQFVGPTSLVTMEKATEYNANHDELETTYGPQVAIIDKDINDKTAKIVVNILDNYSGNISDVKIIGKIPFEGNKYQILSNKDMGSTFTTTMSEGIQVPEKLKNYVTVYYSSNEVVSSYLFDESNNWVRAEDVTDLSNVKNYYIDLGEYVLKNGESIDFSYRIEIPEGLNFNAVSYATHAAYFNLETIEGKLAEKVETNKLGFMIAKKFNLNINKVKEFTNINLQGARFQLVDDEGKRIVKSSSSTGTLEFNNLFVNRVYELKEIKAPELYDLNNFNIKFRTVINERGELTFEIIEGEVKTLSIEGNNVRIVVENTPKFDLNIQKYEKDTNTVIKNVSFEIKKSGQERGSILSTDENGKISLSNLSIGEEYIIKEVKAKGYYLDDSETRFRVIKTNESDFALEIIQGNLKSNRIVSNNTTREKPVVSLAYENEKVPTYNLTVAKYEIGTDTLLAGATFKLSGPGFEDGESFTTNENGEINISGLYRYVEGKNINAVYTLKEVVPPEGYKLSGEDIVFRVQVIDGIPKLDIISGTIKNDLEAQNNNGGVIISFNGEELNAKFAVNDEPLFKLIKKDGEDGTAIPNTKFKIVEILDRNGKEGPALDPSGEKVGTTEIYQNEEIQIVTTNEKGEISLGLRSGIYKLVEIEAAEGYELPEKEEDRTYFFGIDKSTEEVRDVAINFEKEIEGRGETWIYSHAVLDDGSFVEVGYLYSGERLVIPGRETVSGEDIVVEIPIEKQIEYESLGLIIKRTPDGMVEFVHVFESTYKAWDDIEGVCATADGGFAVWGYGQGNATIPAEYMENNTDYVIEADEENKIAVIFKYNSEGKIEWVGSIEGKNSWFGKPGVECSNGDLAVMITGNGFKIKAEDTVDGNEIIAEQRYGEQVVIYNNEGLVKKCIDVREIYNDIGRLFYDNGYLYVIVENTGSNNTILGQYSVSGDPISIKSNFSYLLKLNSDYLIESYLEISNASRMSGIKTFDDNSIIVVAKKYNNNNSVQLSGEMIKENSGNINTNTQNDGVVVKIDPEGKIEWNNTITIGNSYDGWINIIKDNENNIIINDFFNNSSTSVPLTVRYLSTETADETEKTYAFDGKYGLAVYKYSEDGKFLEVDELEQFKDLMIEDFITKDDYNYILFKNRSGKDEIIFNSQDTVNGDEIVLKLEYCDYAPIRIKMDANNKIVRTSTLFEGESYNNFTKLIDNGNGYTAFGSVYMNNIVFDETETESGEEIIINDAFNKGIIVDLNYDFKVKSVKMISTIPSTIKANSDGSFFVRLHKNAGAKMIIPAEETASGEEFVIDAENSGYYILKYNSDYMFEYLLEDSVGDLLITSYPKEGAVLYYTSNKRKTIPAESTVNNEELVASTPNSGYYYKVNDEGKVEWLKNSYVPISDYIETTDGYYLIGRGTGNVKIPAQETVSGEEIQLNKIGNSNYRAIVIKYNNDNKVEWAVQFQTETFYTYFADLLEDGNLAITYYNKEDGSPYVIPSENTEANIGDISIEGSEGKDTGFAIINKEGKIVDVQLIGNNFRKMYKTQDGGFMYVGMDSVDISEDQTVSGKAYYGEYSYCNYIVKVNKDYKIENVYKLNTPFYTYDMLEKDGKYYFVGDRIDVNASIMSIEDRLINPTLAPSVELEINNTKIKYSITCNVIKHEELDDVNNIVQVEGGTISGNGSTIEEPYEVVTYGDNSTKEIRIEPYTGYKVLSIKINDKELDFAPFELDDGVVVLNQFENMHENKNITVEFSKEVSSVIAHYYLENTGEEYGTEPVKIAEDSIQRGKVGENYYTSPEIDINDYELIKDVEGNYIIPSNASGKYEDSEINVYYYYSEKEIPLVVHYYIEGTDKPVPLIDGGEAESVEESGKRGTLYTTEEISSDIIDPKYELIEIPTNATGVYEDDAVVVNYYYRIKDSAGIIVYHIDKMTGEEIAPTEVLPIDGTAKVGDTYITSQSNDIPINYTFDSRTDNYTGEYAVEEIEVTYYYVQVESTLEETSIEKEGREDAVKQKDEPIDYKIVFKTKVGSYKGDVQIVIVDELPFDIDASKSTLDGGTYDENSNTITWTIIEKDVDALENTIDLLYNKNIKIVYNNIPSDADSIENHIIGTVLLKGTSMTRTVEDDYIVPIEKAGKVIVKYVDKNTNKEISSKSTHNGLINEEFDINGDKKDIEGYILLEEPEEKTGLYSETTQEFTYYYAKTSEIVIKYIDKNTNVSIEEKVSHTGLVNEEFDITKDKKDINGYILLEEPEEKTGHYSEETQTFIYYYAKMTRVIVEYRDGKTYDRLEKDTVIDGYEGKEYSTEEKSFEGYKINDLRYPDNTKGTMTDTPIVVRYYYYKETKPVDITPSNPTKPEPSNPTPSNANNNSNNNPANTNNSNNNPKEVRVIIQDGNSNNNQRIVYTNNDATLNSIEATSNSDGKITTVVKNVPDTEKNSYYHIIALLFVISGCYILIISKQNKNK